MECLHCQVKELWEEVSKLHSIRADKKGIDQIFCKTVETEEPEPPATLKQEQECVVLIKLGNRARRVVMARTL